MNLVGNPKFEELKASNHLPSPSAVALEILRLTQNENLNIDTLVPLIKADPALAGRVLKLANSAALYQERPVVAIKEAIVKLGINLLSRLVLSLSILDNNQAGQCEAFDYSDFWSRSLLRALSMQAMSKYLKLTPAEDAFTIGLVAEIGQLALAQVYPQEYSSCLREHQKLLKEQSFCQCCVLRPTCLDANGHQLIEREQAMFAIDHNQITLGMLQDWHLPAHIIEAVSLYQTQHGDLTEFSSSEEKLAGQLKLAAMLAGQIELKDSVMGIQILSEQLGLKDEHMHPLLDQLFLDWAAWKKLLNFGESPEQSAGQAAKGLQSAGGDGLKIMVVDDSPIETHVIATYLRSKGHSVVTANDAETALRQIIAEPQQVLITDYRMQQMDGIELCSALRANASTRLLYIILVTADKDAATLTKAFEAGVNDFIGKPINQIELDARLIGAKRTLGLQGAQNNEREHIQRQAFELATATRKLEQMALTDQLTHLPNRRYAQSFLNQQWQAFLDKSQIFAIISLDLDHFKQVNDNYGHDVGDQVLIHFAQLLKKSLRGHDLAFRIGGEEFIVVVRRVDVSELAILAERIRLNVETQQPTHLQLSRPISVSIGAALVDASLDKTGWQDTLKRSDQALYAAKAAGRNNVKLFERASQNRSERIAHVAKIKVKYLSESPQSEFSALLKDMSESGLFIMMGNKTLPALGTMVEVQTTEIADAPILQAKVVRLAERGFAVEFLSTT